MPDVNTVWTVLHDVGLATVGAWIGGRYALGVAKLQSRDQRDKERVDRRRELVREIGVKFGHVLFELKRFEDRSIARADEFVEKHTAGTTPEWMEGKSVDTIIALLKQINDLYLLAQIDGHGGIASSLIKYMHAFQRIEKALHKLLRASHGGTIPEDVSAELKAAQAEREKLLNELYAHIREAYNA